MIQITEPINQIRTRVRNEANTTKMLNSISQNHPFYRIQVVQSSLQSQPSSKSNRFSVSLSMIPHKTFSRTTIQKY